MNTDDGLCAARYISKEGTDRMARSHSPSGCTAAGHIVYATQVICTFVVALSVFVPTERCGVALVALSHTHPLLVHIRDRCHGPDRLAQ